MSDFRADLHCHTTCSDGTLSPVEIVELAAKKGLRGLSITDHDTIEAYKTAIPAAKALNLPLISGVEFSSMHDQVSIHLLAYSFPLDSPLILEFCKKHEHRRVLRNREILDLLFKQGMPITEEELEHEHDPGPSHNLGRPHIALAMLKKGYISSIQEAFNEYIGEGKPCYAPGGYFSVEETVDLIHKAKGLAVIAHPHLINNEEILRDLLEMDFDGIEGYYARFSREDEERWVRIGNRKGWLITGGSDFHGDIKPTIPLGSSWVDEAKFNALYARFKENNSQI